MIDRFSIGYVSSFAGVRITESEAATALPSAKPCTDDMRDMIEHMHRLGLIQRKPAAFQTPHGLVIHPKLMRDLQHRLSRDLDKMAEAAFYGAIR